MCHEAGFKNEQVTILRKGINPERRNFCLSTQERRRDKEKIKKTIILWFWLRGPTEQSAPE